MSESRVNFVRQQGFRDATTRAADSQYPTLMFQPRIVGVIALAGVLLQSPWVFLALSAVLWWNVALPALNPFDRLYDALVGARRGLPSLPPAPAPRRFAQGMAATFTLLIGVSLLAGLSVLSWILQALLLVAVGALVFGKLCAGSYVYLVLTSQGGFAQCTLPWGRGA
jgi:Domain of unknown function (DUF4395)